MSENIVKIRVRLGANEAEIEAPISAIKDVIHLVPEVIQRLPQTASVTAPQKEQELAARIADVKLITEESKSATTKQTIIPEIRVEKDDSLPNVITKFFQDHWGRQPRKLSDIRDVLESYGLIYPKQSVAVALLRLAKEGKLRRFKDENGEFVYTASTGLSAAWPSSTSESINSHKDDPSSSEGVSG